MDGGRIIRSSAFVLAVAAIALAVGYGIGHSGRSSNSAATPRSITVGGTGIVSSVPHEADFTYGVSVNAATSKEASAANATTMTKVIAALKAHGIAAADIQTNEVSVEQNYGNDGNVTGYNATNSVTVRVRDLANAGVVNDAAVKAGANQTSGPNYVTTDQQPAYEEALKDAIADARNRALAIASASNVTLGAISVVTEEEPSSSPLPFAAAAKSGAGATTPIEAGNLQVEADVTVTFAVK